MIDWGVGCWKVLMSVGKGGVEKGSQVEQSRVWWIHTNTQRTLFTC